MRRISSAPCISGLQQSNTNGITVQYMPNLQSIRTCPSIGSTCGSISGSAIGVGVGVGQDITPNDMFVVQNIAPVSQISQCLYDKAINGSHDIKELALCVVTPSQAPELATREPLSTRLQERHLAFMEVRLRSRSRNKSQSLLDTHPDDISDISDISDIYMPHFTPNDVY
jgi:hypothetical protein